MAGQNTAIVNQAIGRETPDFALELIHGGTQSLVGALTGRKGAVVVFWSSVCSHCLRYDSYLDGFSARHPELALLALASRPRETPDEIRAAAKKRGLSFPILVDSGGRVARQWFTEQTPRAFLIGADRKLLYRGAIDNFQLPDDPDHAAYLEPAIEDFLAGRPVAQPETASFGCAIQSVYYILPKIL
jgi:peroxiredoxin